MLPDYPVTSITSIQAGSVIVPRSVLPLAQGQTPVAGVNYGCWGYRFIPWAGQLPGSPAIIQLTNGIWWMGSQNIEAIYQAGYLISNESWTVPTTPFQVTVFQPNGICSKDNGVTYANGTALTAVAANPTAGQYVPPADANPGLYTFSAADAGASVLISYSYVPADLTEACNQMIAERLSYRSRIGVMSQSLAGQETIRYMRGGLNYGPLAGLPPEVAELAMPYFNVTPPGDVGELL
jgi:hypothetical protein